MSFPLFCLNTIWTQRDFPHQVPRFGGFDIFETHWADHTDLQQSALLRCYPLSGTYQPISYYGFKQRFFPYRIYLFSSNRFKASPKQDALTPFPLPELQRYYASIRLLRLPRFGFPPWVIPFNLPCAGALPLREATWTRTLTLRKGQPKTSLVSLINLLPHPRRLYATACLTYHGFPCLKGSSPVSITPQ